MKLELPQGGRESRRAPMKTGKEVGQPRMRAKLIGNAGEEGSGRIPGWGSWRATLKWEMWI